MLSQKNTLTLLFVEPYLVHLIGTYKRKLKYLTGFYHNIEVIPAEITIELIINTIDIIDALTSLKNVIMTAKSLLSEKELKIINSIYFEKQTFCDVALRYGYTIKKLRVILKKAFEKLARNIVILGFDKKRIIEYFDDIPVFIECACLAQGVENVE